MSSLSTFESKIGHIFSDKRLVETAFTHRSFLNENRVPGREHNERLEFLGDAVLELVVTDFLYKKYPEKPEGELTAVRAALVNTVSISDAAGKLGMNEYLMLSRGESRDTGRARAIILANAFEAVIGALYLDAGYDAAQKFIEAQLFHKTDEVVAKRLWQDAKSRFQSIRQFLLAEGGMEVDTPVLERIPGGADAEPFRTHMNALDIDLFLRIR
jgi:ribonuclease-3